MPMAPELEPGSELAGFRVDRLIAAGGMGAVYLAHDATLRRRVALKVVAPALADDARYRNRFLAEARLAASLEHPAIVPIYAAGESDARLYLAMRFLEDGSLAGLLAQRGRLPVAQTVALLEPVAAALDAAHTAGLVHRDVKPANILLDGERALLGDFGLAMSARAESLLSADALHLSGTMGYVAPEQIEGDRAGPAADQYAFACVAFECLVGRRPFPRETELAVIYAHISEPPPSAADLVADLPRALDPVLARGLAKRPDQRFPTCAEFVRGIAAACGIATSSTTVPSSRHGWVIAAGTAVAVVAVGAVAVGLVTRSGNGAPAAPAAAAPRPTDAVITLDAATLRTRRSTGVAATPLAFAVGPQSTLVVAADGAISLAGDQGAATNLGEAPDEAVDAEFASGAFWMTTRHATAAPFTVGDRLVRIDPATFDQSAPLLLPGSSAAAPGLRGKQLAGVGDVLWVVDPDGSVERIDDPNRPPAVGRERGFGAEAVAAGDIGVWALGDRIGAVGDRTGPYVWRVDGPTDAPSAPVPVEAASATGLAVGGGSVWVADPVDGRIHRIRPGPLNTTVAVGRGVDSLSFDAGRLWAANSATGELWTINPSTEQRTRVRTSGRPVAVEARFSVAAAAALAPPPRVSSLSPRRLADTPALQECSTIETAAGRRPDLVVIGDFPVGTRDGEGDIAAARAVLRDSAYQVGGKTVGFQVCRSATSVFGNDCQRRADQFANARRVAVVIEAGGSDCVRQLSPRLYAAGVSILDIRDTAEDLTLPQPSYSTVFRLVGSVRAQADAQVAMLRASACAGSSCSRRLRGPAVRTTPPGDRTARMPSRRRPEPRAWTSSAADG